MTGGTKSISLSLFTLPSLPLSLGLGPCHLCSPKKKEADREATVWRRKLCWVGEHQHRLAHQCSPCEKISTHMKCEVKHNGDMGMGQLWLTMGGAFMACNGWGSYKFRVWLWLKWVGQLWQSKHRASVRFKLLCCSCMASPRGNPSRLRAAKSTSNTATFIGLSVEQLLSGIRGGRTVLNFANY